MSGKTGIDWTDATWNYLPWRCKPVSAGCENCYARALTDRGQGNGSFESEPPPWLRMNRLLLPWTDPEFRAAFRISRTGRSGLILAGRDTRQGGAGRGGQGRGRGPGLLSLHMLCASPMVASTTAISSTWIVAAACLCTRLTSNPSRIATAEHLGRHVD